METFVGDTVQIVIDVGIDISAYGTKRIKFRRPDGTTGWWTAAACVGDDECMTYTTDMDDLNVAGIWRLQSYVEQGASRLHGKWDDMYVYEALFEYWTTAPPTTVAPTTVPPTTLAPTT